MGYGEREGIEGECEVSRKLSLDSCISTKNESTKKKKKQDTQLIQNGERKEIVLIEFEIHVSNVSKHLVDDSL